MYKRLCIFVVWLAFTVAAGTGFAQTYHLTDGKEISGEIVSADGQGAVLKQGADTYSDRIPWTKFSQADLRELAQNPKAGAFVEPFIEPLPSEKPQRPEIQIKEVQTLAHPPKGSFIAAMFKSSIGLFIIFVLYAANIYAAYEIALFRARQVGLVCGVSAVVPVIGPIIFLSMPPQLKEKAATWQQTAEAQAADAAVQAAIAADEGAAAAAEEAAAAAAVPAKPVVNLPPTKTFARGQFMFNRRFFETQLAPFFAMTRPEAEKDKVLTVKTARGSYIVQRVTRVTANDITLHIVKGEASEDVVIPFPEVQEVQVKHKDSPD